MSPRRSPEAVAHAKRIKEGRDFERIAVPADLVANGYEVVFAHASHGKVDFLAIKTGQVLAVGGRLTSPSETSPRFADDEWESIWAFAKLAAPGFEVVPLLATARHAGGPPNGSGRCRCSKLAPDPVRYLRLTGPASERGQGRTPPWESWSPDFALEMAG